MAGERWGLHWGGGMGPTSRAELVEVLESTRGGSKSMRSPKIGDSLLQGLPGGIQETQGPRKFSAH